MVTQFEAGALDLIRGAALTDVVRLKGSPQYQAIIHPITNYQQYVVGANVTTPPLDNQKLRQALNYALDRQRFVDTVLMGLGNAQDLPWSSSHPMYEADKMNRYALDLDRAMALVTESGVANPSIDISPYPPDPEANRFAEIYQADLAKIGVKLNISKLESAAWTTQINSGKLNGLYIAPSVNLHLQPATLFSLSRVFNPDNNNELFKDDTYSRLVASVQSETDASKLKPVYSQLNDVLLDQSFVMPLSPEPLQMVARAGVRDLTADWHGGWLYTSARIDG
jgi:peptide/nickel transport system substrate-binding protein